jgi:hypothetical protein
MPMNPLRPLLTASFLFALCVSLGGFPATVAAVPGPDPVSADGRSWILEPYFLVPNMSGTAVVHGLESDVNAGSGDILGALDFGAMLYIEMHGPKTSVSLDNTYMNLGADGSTALGDVSVDLRQTGVALTGYRRFGRCFEGSLGLTFNRIKGGLTSTGPLGIDREAHQTWVDPYVGVRLQTPDPKRWRFTFTGSVGGFGVGSDFAWQAYPEIGYRCSPTFELSGGFRAIDMDFENGAGSDAFKYDVTTYGPQLGAKFHF